MTYSRDIFRRELVGSIRNKETGLWERTVSSQQSAVSIKVSYRLIFKRVWDSSCSASSSFDRETRTFSCCPLPTFEQRRYPLVGLLSLFCLCAQFVVVLESSARSPECRKSHLLCCSCCRCCCRCRTLLCPVRHGQTGYYVD